MTEFPVKKKLVVIGNGMAPGRAIERLLQEDPTLYDITIFNAEDRVNYNRIMLSPILSNEVNYEDIIIHDDAWYQENNIVLHKGEKVVQIDRTQKMVSSEKGIKAHYDTLLIATGSSPIMIPIPGHELEGVLTYRDLDDVYAMVDAAKTKKHAVVIGGGLLGIEAAAGLKAQGMEVTILHLMPTLMERQLDPVAGRLLEKAMRNRGISVITNANTTELKGETHVSSVLLDDGTEIRADIVCMAVGIRPNSNLAKTAGLEVGRGIIVGDDMKTSDPDIYAIGECVEHRGVCYGLVAPLYEMANVIAMRLLGGCDKYSGTEMATQLKVTGINLFSAGDFSKGPDREEIVLRTSNGNIYKRLILQHDKLIGVVLYGDISGSRWFLDLLKYGRDVSAMRQTLLFGEAFQEDATLLDISAVEAA